MSNSRKFKMIGVAISLLALTSCAAISARPGAETIAIVTEKPNPEKCKLLGEVAGSQGNWFTGGYTSDKNLMVGARNDLRNATYDMGGNTVYLQNISNSGRFMASGTSNTTVVGYAYKCK
jgi:Domain of unknown function (DUF4156)